MTEKISVFIDTNVFLAFHHYTKDDIEQLKIVLELVNSGQLELFSTSQVVDEYNRNREEKLANAIKEFTSKGKLPGVPRCMAAYDESNEYREALEKIEKAKDQLVQLVKSDAAERKLPADLLFDQIVEKSVLIEATDALYSKGLRRKNSGNPPGKSNSLGDQLSWECLLERVSSNTDLHIISMDGDFASDLTSSDVNPFLADEWKEKNGGTLRLNEQLRPFLKDKFPAIELAIDVEKNEAIESLLATGNFHQTHLQVAKLKPMIGSISWGDADRILTAGVENSQIAWIGTDEDVRTFYRELINKYQDKITGNRNELLNAFFPQETAPDVESNDDSIPY